MSEVNDSGVLTMSRRFITLTFVAVLALAVATGATGATATHTISAPVVTFTDETGDSGTAADITTVGVTNDDKGQYSFTINLATPYGAAGGMSVYLDTDLNPSTGDPQALGADYLLVDDNAANTGYFLKWDGTKWVDAPTSSTVTDSVATDSKRVSLSVNKSELGDAAGFNFFVESIDGDGSTGHWDDGPSGTGSWQYKLQTVLQLSIVTFHSFAVKAGGTWGVALVVGRSDTSATVGSEGAIACHATAGATKLALVTRAFVSGGTDKGSAAVCVFKVPKKFKHKVLHATVTVSLKGQSVSHSFTTTVK